MTVGPRERLVQNRVVGLLGALGWRHLGDWSQRAGNANIEPALLEPWLAARGRYPAPVIRRAVDALTRAAANRTDDLYDVNRAVYDLLRGGVKVPDEATGGFTTVHVIDWENPRANDLALAEEVAVAATSPKAFDKRPDVVLYVNGVALGVLELKRSTVSVAEGIRQNLTNQTPDFIERFFTTIQFLMAGNDSEGLRYGMIGTPQKHFLRWKEPGELANRLDRDLTQMLAPARFLELIHDFTVFDKGAKKTARPNQYFGVKAAQLAAEAGESGVIWQTQGSGKSLIMVMLARWILERITGSRLLIITDRKELDDQIAGDVFGGAGISVRKARSGADLRAALADSKDGIVCSLVHKFGASAERAAEDFIGEIAGAGGTAPRGRFFVFVDEAHRTQSGKLAQAMRAILPDAVFIGFTGTPLLRTDKRTTMETFGPFIGEPYRFDEAVQDGVVLDLRYEARDIDQRLGSREHIDAWFETKTAGLPPLARAAIKARWGTLQAVMSSRSRLDQIVSDIVFDMARKPRLAAGRGTAMLVAGSIREACVLYDLFQKTELKGKCAVITSYRPGAHNIRAEETGEGQTEAQLIHDTYKALLGDQTPEAYEAAALETFKTRPATMRLLIVVDRLLTGFDAPTATVLYIDKKMRDHGLFQAICRVNRLDGEDKEYGYIVDYKDLFRRIDTAITDYTSGAFDGYDRADVEGLILDRAAEARNDLEAALAAVRGMIEGVEQPRGEDDWFAFFCDAESDDLDMIEEKAARRQALYRLVGGLARAFEEAAEDPVASGYTPEAIDAIRMEVAEYVRARDAVRLRACENVDMKLYEPAMRHLIDTYISADHARKVSAFDDMSLVEILIERGPAAAEEAVGSAAPRNVAETIENNVRRLIVEETPINPRFYANMSALLAGLIDRRRRDVVDYATYLAEIAELARRAQHGPGAAEYPPTITTAGARALYDNLKNNEALAVALDKAVRDAAQKSWRGDRVKENRVRRAIHGVIPEEELAARVFELVAASRDYGGA